MPEVLNEWPIKPAQRDRFLPLFDGKIYRVAPAEFDCDTAEDLRKAIRYTAAKHRIYIRCFVTLDEHVIVSKQPADYVPKQGQFQKRRKVTP